MWGRDLGRIGTFVNLTQLYVVKFFCSCVLFHPLVSHVMYDDKYGNTTNDSNTSSIMIEASSARGKWIRYYV